jgi:regulator of cell morphogenesis and NO signaling
LLDARADLAEGIMLAADTTVVRAVLDHSECATVFQRHRIDYCCQGKRTIAAACAERGVDLALVLGELERAIAERARSGERDPSYLGTSELIAHIVTTHHDYLRQAMPFVRSLAAKVARVHGDADIRLRELDTIVAELSSLLVPHLDDEEDSLFPAMRDPRAALEPLRAELAAARDDHAAVGGLLERLRDVTADYALPSWACTSYRTLFAELAQLEDDVRRHVHLENNVLWPRFEAA